MRAKRSICNRWRRSALLCTVLAGLVAGGGALAAEPTAGGHYERALAAADKGELETAVIHLKNALQLEPDNLPARILLGRVLLEGGAPEAAEKELKTARSLGADEAILLIPLAKAYLMQDKYEQVVDEIVPAGLGRDVEATVQLLRAEAFLGLRRPDDAEGAFFAATRLMPNDPRGFVGLGRVAFIEGNIQGAANFAEKALQLAGDSAGAWSLKGDIERYLRQPQAALVAYQAAIDADPDQVPARVNRAAILVELGRLDEARAEIAEIRARIPGDPRADYLDALVLAREGRNADARVALESAATTLKRRSLRTLRSHPPTVLLNGLIAFALENFEEATTYLSRYVHLRPNDPYGHEILGALHIRMGNTLAAVEELKKVLAIRPDDVRILNMIAAAFIENGQYDRGTAYFIRAARLEPDSIPARMRLGLGYLASGEVREAVDELKAAFEKAPESLQAGIFLALAQLHNRNFDDAIRTARKIESSHPDVPYVQNLLGTALLGRGDFDQARKRFEHALALDPRYVPAHLNLARLDARAGDLDAAIRRYNQILAWDNRQIQAIVELAKLAHARNQMDAAIAGMERARALDPDNPAPWYSLVSYQAEKGEFDEALRIAEDYRRQHPQDLRMLRLTAEVQFAAGRHKDAIGLLREVVELSDRRGPALYELGQLQERVGDLSGARIAYRRAIAWDRSMVPAWRALIDLISRSGNTDEALSLVADLRTAVPEAPATDLIAARVLRRAGQFRKAERLLRRLIAREASAEATIELYRVLAGSQQLARGIKLLENWLAGHDDDHGVRLILANGYIRAGALRKAIALYEALNRRVPDNPVVLNNLAWLYHKVADERALDFAMRAYARAPDDALVLDTYGWILVQKGEATRGLSLLREARTRAATDPQIHYHLAAALAALGRTDEARRELEQLLRADTAFDEVAEARALLQQLGAAPQP